MTVSDHRVDEKYEFSSALGGTRNVVFFTADLLYFELPCVQSDSMRVWATWPLEWLLLESTIILHGLRHILSQTRSHGDNFGASNIEHRGSSSKYTNGFFICFYVRGTALCYHRWTCLKEEQGNNIILTRVCCILNLYWRSIHFLTRFSRH